MSGTKRSCIQDYKLLDSLATFNEKTIAFQPNIRCYSRSFEHRLGGMKRPEKLLKGLLLYDDLP
eukprot:Pgem_evm1s8603